MSRTFIKKKEDFVCEHCGQRVLGDGYTNHCPACLFSKHVDVHPGDRASSCCGLMEPRAVIQKGGGYTLEHVCMRCEQITIVTLRPSDNFDAAISLCYDEETVEK